jgi:hypothetical protein
VFTASESSTPSTMWPTMGFEQLRGFFQAALFWPNLAADVRAWCRSCQCYAAAKITAQPQGPLNTLIMGSRGLVCHPYSQFSLAVWAVFTANLGVHHIMMTAYHPQINSLVERIHHQLKEVLKARLASTDEPGHLPWVMFGLKGQCHEISAPQFFHQIIPPGP